MVFGLYVETHDEPHITNNTTPRTDECIDFVQTGNIQGTHKVFFLDSGGLLNRRNSITMVVSERIIKKVKDWCNNLKEGIIKNPLGY